METPRPEPPGSPTANATGDVLIIGNLQSGKTTLFQRLRGQRPQALEIPETSRSLERGLLIGHGLGGLSRRLRQRLGRVRGTGDDPHAGVAAILDTPGTATLFPQSEEELVVRDALLRIRPRALLIVADAKNLRRSLALVAHAAELQLPAVLALNMEDEARVRGIEIDHGLLASQLGIDVVPTVATLGLGVEQLARRLEHARVPRRFARLPGRLAPLVDELELQLAGLPVSPRGVGLLLIAHDRGAERLVREQLGEEALATARQLVGAAAGSQEIQPQVTVSEAFHAAGARLAEQVIIRRDARRRYLDRFGRWAHHPVAGLLIAALVVALMYLWVGELGATRVVDWIAVNVFEAHLIPASDRLVSLLPWPIVREAIMDPEFGLLPTGLFLAFGLVLPVLFFFYLAFNVLVHSGYLPRLSILLDRLFRVIGLNGRGILPLAMGLSCVTMALITTRMLETKKERTIASFLLLLGTPCAPLLSMMLVVLADLPITATVAVFGVIITQTIVAGMLSRKVMGGGSSDFIMEITPMRVPRIGHLLSETVRQTAHFMKEAVPLFLAASLVLFAVDRLGGLEALASASRPLVNGWLGLPDESVQVFVKTLIRREAGAAELAQVTDRYTNLQLVVTLLVMTFLTPCANAILVLFKERGPRTALLLVAAVSTYAVLVGAAVNHLCRWLGITFG